MAILANGGARPDIGTVPSLRRLRRRSRGVRARPLLYQVFDDRLRDRAFVAGDYSIADIAIYPWIRRLEREGSHLNGFANLKRWHDAISRRPAVIRAYERSDAINTTPTITEDSKKLLLGA